ncbi:MAG: HlyD family efflux transporter periplasmic adaptor subunit, partial [Bacteroidales bacterium]|nr:HlyD family efflux transporter periplasmic adaptor subunit [Bacteroidales bacterium]
WGTTIISLTIIILITGSALFRYPDILYADVVLTTQNPPADLVARTSGKIQKLFVKDNQTVKAGEFIALLETAADYEDIVSVENILVQSGKNQEINQLKGIDNNYGLGEIQPVFAEFVKTLHDYNNFLNLNYHQKKIEAVKNELMKHADYNQRLEEQSVVQKKELALVRRQFGRDSLLFRQGVIASSDFEKSESAMLKSEFSLKETETNLATARIEVSKLNQQILDLELELNKEQKQKEVVLNEAYNKLMAQIEIWKQKYLLISPIEGKVSFTKFWSENQQVMENEVVTTVIPHQPGEIIGKINLSVEGAGKVRPGQPVNIKFANYPYMEFGMVKGIISSISAVPAEKFYTAEVSLPMGLITNYDRQIAFSQQMPGTAEIITDNMSLLKRIINPVKSALKRQQMNN